MAIGSNYFYVKSSFISISYQKIMFRRLRDINDLVRKRSLVEEPLLVRKTEMLST